MNKKIIAIDPSGNGTTGLFYGQLDKDLICVNADWASLKTDNYTHSINFINNFIHFSIGQLEWELKDNKKSFEKYEIYLVIEDYKDRGITRDSSTAKLISTIQSDTVNWCKENNKNLIEIKLQQPSNKALITNDYLKRNNLIFKPNQIKLNLKNHSNEKTTGHVLDAFRHWIYYCNKKFFNKKINFEKLFKNLFENARQ